MLTLTGTVLCKEGVAGVLIYLDSDAILRIEIAAARRARCVDALFLPL